MGNWTVKGSATQIWNIFRKFL